MAASVIVILKAHKAHFERGMKAVQRVLTNVIARMKMLAARARFMLMAVGGAVIGLTMLYGRQEKAEAKLNAVLRSTGYAAGFSAAALKKHAAELQKVTTYGDEAIITLQAVLATFVNIKGDVFRDATEAILGMATVLDSDLRMAAVQVGKALNDPIKGVTALGRSGVSFTEIQKDLIRTLVETGNTLAAQRIILVELNKEFGGAAREAAKGYAGQLAQVKNELGDMGEVLGRILIPLLLDFAKWVKDIAGRIGRWTQAHGELTRKVAATSIAVLALLVLLPKMAGAILLITGAVGKLAVAFSWLAANPIVLVITAITALGTAIVLTARKIANFTKEQKAANIAAMDYTEALREAGQAAKAVNEASNIEEVIKALKERIRLEEQLVEDAPEARFRKIHQENVDRLVKQISLLEQQRDAVDQVADRQKQAFEMELKAAVFAANQAGKSQKEQERLALAAKGYTDAQVEQIQIQTRLAAVREKAATNIRKAEEARIRMIESLNKKMEDVKVTAQAEADKIQEAFAGRLAQEQAITAEREAQLAASRAGRFVGLADMWKRIQTATIQAPIKREADQLQKTREVADNSKKISRLQADANKILDQIRQTLDKIAGAPEGARFAF